MITCTHGNDGSCSAPAVWVYCLRPGRVHEAQQLIDHAHPMCARHMRAFRQGTTGYFLWCAYTPVVWQRWVTAQKVIFSL